MFTIGYLAKLSKLTVRTLRYYDEIGLLKPTRVSEGKHRYYDERAMEKLQNILLLKDLGFNLQTIQSILDENVKSSKELLELRLEMIADEQTRLEHKKSRIKAILEVMEMEGKNDWESIFKTITEIKNYDFTKIRKRWNEYFTEEEQQILDSMPKLGDGSPLGEKIIQLIKTTKESIDEDPSSKAAQNLMDKWIDLLEEMYQGNKKLMDKVWRFQVNGNEEDIGIYQLEPELIQFIKNVQQYYSEVRNN